MVKSVSTIIHLVDLDESILNMQFVVAGPGLSQVNDQERFLDHLTFNCVP